MCRDEFFESPLSHAYKIENLAGMRFDKLLVIKLVGRRLYGGRNSGPALWECLCDCGTTKNIPATQLKRGKARSCSCYVRKYRSINMRSKYPEGHAAKTQIFLAYEHGAKRRNVEFKLTKEEVIKLISQNCNYCGTEPLNEKKLKHRDPFKYNGIDRVDNTLGYSSENVVTCCETCNRAKLEMTTPTFLRWIEKVYRHSFGVK